MIDVVISKHGYVRLFVGGAEEMWERVKSSSPKFLYQTSDSANSHSAIIKIRIFVKLYLSETGKARLMNRHLLNPNCAKAFRLFNLALSL